MFDNIERIFKKFRFGLDYYIWENGLKRVYYIYSGDLKEAISPFPKLAEVSGGRKSEKSESGNYFSYEEGMDNSPDKFTVIKNSEVVQEKFGEIKLLDLQAKEWDKEAEILDREATYWDSQNSQIAQNPHPRTVSFTIRNNQGEKVFERTQTSTYYPVGLTQNDFSLKIEEIDEENKESGVKSHKVIKKRKAKANVVFYKRKKSSEFRRGKTDLEFKQEVPPKKE